jgi:hypothetical protein
LQNLADTNSVTYRIALLATFGIIAFAFSDLLSLSENTKKLGKKWQSSRLLEESDRLVQSVLNNSTDKRLTSEDRLIVQMAQHIMPVTPESQHTPIIVFDLSQVKPETDINAIIQRACEIANSASFYQSTREKTDANGSVLHSDVKLIRPIIELDANVRSAAAKLDIEYEQLVYVFFFFFFLLHKFVTFVDAKCFV